MRNDEARLNKESENRGWGNGVNDSWFAGIDCKYLKYEVRDKRVLEAEPGLPRRISK